MVTSTYDLPARWLRDEAAQLRRKAHDDYAATTWLREASSFYAAACRKAAECLDQSAREWEAEMSRRRTEGK